MRFYALTLILLFCSVSVCLGQVGRPGGIGGGLITPQRRKMPINWFRKPFGQMRPEIMKREMDKVQSQITSIRIPRNVSPLSRSLHFSAYSISSTMPIRRQRTFADPAASFRLSSWFFYRRGETERTQWWESHLRSTIIRGMVFQPRFNGVLSENAILNETPFSNDPPVDALRQSILSRANSSIAPVSIPTSASPRGSTETIVPNLPKDSPVVVPKQQVAPSTKSPTTGSMPKRTLRPRRGGDIGPGRGKNVAPNVNYRGSFFNDMLNLAF